MASNTALFQMINRVAAKVKNLTAGGGTADSELVTKGFASVTNSPVTTLIDGLGLVAGDSTGGYYNTPSVCKMGGIVYAVYANKPGHVPTKNCYLQKSFDDGVTWETPAPIVVNGAEIIGNAIEIGATKSGRLVLIYAGEDDIFAEAFFAYSDDGGTTWIDAGAVATPAGNYVGASPHGQFVQLKSGTILTTSYAYNLETPGAPCIIFLYISTDNGVSWDTVKSGGTTVAVLTGAKGAAYPLVGCIVEPALEVVEDTGDDATVKLLCCVRDEDYSHAHWMVKSVGLTSWTSQGAVFEETAGYAYPINLFRDGEYMYANASFRGVRAVSQVRCSVKVWKAKAIDVYNNKANWGETRIVYSPLINQKGNLNDFGYVRAWRCESGEIKAILYDSSFKEVPTSATTRYTAIRCIPINVKPILDVYNCNSAGTYDQSIAGDGVAARVGFYLARLDSEHHFNEAGNGQGVVIRQDGDYEFEFTCEWENLASGTYRRIYIQLRDPNGNNATYPPSGQYVTNATHTIIDRSILPSTVAGLNRMQIRKFVPGCYAGQEVLIWAQTNGGSPVKLINSNIDTCVRLVMRKTN